MKTLLAALLFSIAFVAGVVAAECTKLTITGHPEYPPVGWREGDRIVGAGAAVVSGITRDLGLAVESKYAGPWADAQTAVRNGRVDVIFGIYFNKERASYLDYVRPAFMIDPVVVMVRKDEAFPFDKWENLLGRKGVTNEGESYGSNFDKFMRERLTVARAKGTGAAFHELIEGKADYMIVGLYPGRAEARRLGIQEQVEALRQPLISADMFIAFSKKSACREHIKAFGPRIAALVKDGSVQSKLLDATSEWEKSLAKSR